EEQGRKAAQGAVAKGGGDGDEGQNHQREIFGRAKGQREFNDEGRDKGQSQRGDQTSDEGTDGGGGESGTAPALAGHLVALERGDDRCRFTGRVEQNGGGGAAIHAAVVDAGEH